ncbi:MAG TPA: hypothetical protein VF510_01865 [Ktedonobacterales bacterium]
MNATTEQAASKVAARLLKMLDRPVEHLEFARDPKTGGWTASFQTPLNSTTHNDNVVAIIALGQRVSYSWILTGDVFCDLDGWSNVSRVSGVTNLHWQLWHEDQIDALGVDDAEH